MDFTSLFCDVDDFCQVFEPLWRARLIGEGKRKRNRASQLALSEIMTILIAFHSSQFRHFKAYYLFLRRHHRHDFPRLVSYSRFKTISPQALVPLCCYLQTCLDEPTGIAYIDSTPLEVCHPKRILRNRVFKDCAARGKAGKGWFHGFKLHLVINDRGGLLAAKVTPGNLDDRRHVREVVAELRGRLFGDKGYIPQALREDLLEQELQLITPIRSNMKNQLMRVINKLLRRRSIIETVNDQLKNICQIEHSRYRSQYSLGINVVCGLICYCHQEKKPSIQWAKEEEPIIQTLINQPLRLPA